MEKSIACLISDHADFRDKVDENLRAYEPIELVKFSNVAEFIKWSKGQKINGVILDFKSLIKTNLTEKEFLNILEKKIILSRSNFNPNTKEIASQVNGEFYQGAEFFKYFVEQILDPKVAKLIRQNERFEKIWSVEIYNEDNSLIEKCVTKNVSAGGLFILTCYDYDQNQNYRIKILELDEEETSSESELIEIEIKWAIPWKKYAKQLPGLGVEFKNTSDRVLKKVKALIDS